MVSLIGTKLGRYEIAGEIGRGSMGVVYRARDPKIDREVAIKTISLAGQDADEEKEYRTRFFHEAKAAGRLSHPGIVTIYDVGEQPETREPYIVMEYVAGDSLNKVLASGQRKLPLDSVLQLCEELANSLHYAHSQGVIHRDIKPANILVTPESHPKVADFGVAKLNLSGLTLPGQVLGSPAFMAPEQLSGDGVDARADLFALGVILYNMLTGHRPFQGNSTSTVCFKLLNRDPLPVTALNSELPPEVDELVARAMAKDPAERFQSGAEMAEAIHAFRGQASGTEDKTVAAVAREAMGKWAPSEAKVVGTTSRPQPSSTRPQPKTSVRPAPLRISLTQDQIYLAIAVGLLLVAGSMAIYRGTRSAEEPLAALQSTTSLPEHSGPSAIQSTRVDLNPSNPDSMASGMPEPKVTVREPALLRRRKANLPARPVKSENQDSRKSIATSASAALRALPLSGNVSLIPATASAVTPSSVSIPKTPTPVPANLTLEFDYFFAEGEATVWVDNHLLLAQTLHGEEKKHALFFKRIEGRESKTIQLASGQHTIHVRVHAKDDSYDQSDSVTGTFDSAREMVLQVGSGKHHDDLKLNLQDVSLVPAIQNNH